jgi:REP element-mobilizing transposase RayT
MGRPLRAEIENGVFHATTRAVFEHRAFVTSADRYDFLFLLMRVVRRHDWLLLAYCLMGTHYHLVIETPRPTLSRGMQLLNGWYAQRFNRRHGRRGHLFDGRFHSGLLEDEAHLLRTIRYVEQNAVRAGYCTSPRGWRWCSYRALAGLAASPDFLAVGRTLAYFGEDARTARRAYRAFVESDPEAA